MATLLLHSVYYPSATTSHVLTVQLIKTFRAQAHSKGHALLTLIAQYVWAHLVGVQSWKDVNPGFTHPTRQHKTKHRTRVQLKCGYSKFCVFWYVRLHT